MLKGNPMFTRRSVLTGAMAAPAVVFGATRCFAAEAEYFMEDGVALRGADTVAYFNEGAPVIGTSDFAVKWHGAIWFFASAANMEQFMGNPMAYTPQYGGYCSYAMSRNYIASSVPEAWSIVDGKLYMNYSLRVRDLWSRDISGNIAKAEANWPTILG